MPNSRCASVVWLDQTLHITAMLHSDFRLLLSFVSQHLSIGPDYRNLSAIALLILSLLALLRSCRRTPMAKHIPLLEPVRSTRLPAPTQKLLPPCLSALQSLLVPSRSSIWPKQYRNLGREADASRIGVLDLEIRTLFEDFVAGKIEIRGLEVRLTTSTRFYAYSHVMCFNRGICFGS